MSILRRAKTAATTLSRKLSGDAVTYRRGELEVPIDYATQGKTRWEKTDRNGISVSVYSVDWLIQTDDLELTPQRDDEIEIEIGGRRKVYQVLPFGNENRVFRYHGTDETAVRVYTKLKAETEIP